MAQKATTLTPFYRGDTPYFVMPVSASNGATLDITGFNAFLTFTINDDPTDNTDAFFHKEITTDVTGALINPETGLSFGPNFNHQFTNTETENFDPNAEYHWDLQINKSPSSTNNFTIASGTFKPLTDYSRGLT